MNKVIAFNATSLRVAVVLSLSVPVPSWATDIGFVGVGVDTAFLSSFSNEIKNAGSAAGFDVRLAQADYDATKQASQVNTLIASGVKGLLVDPVDAQAIAPVIARAANQGIPIIPVDSSAGGGKSPVQVATDNYGAGAMACEVIGGRLDGKGIVLNLQGLLGNSTAQARSSGFTDCMTKRFPEMKVISKPFNWSSEVCAQVVQTQLAANHIAGIFAASGQCLTPVLTALKTQGRLKKVNESGHVPFVVVDGTPEEMKAVRDGYLTATIEQPLGDIAKYGVGYLKRVMSGEKINAGPTDHGTTIVENNGALRDLLPPVVVTQKNVESPTLWANKK